MGEGVAGQTWGWGVGGRGGNTLLPFFLRWDRADRALWLGGATIIILITVARVLYAFTMCGVFPRPWPFSRDRNPLFFFARWDRTKGLRSSF